MSTNTTELLSKLVSKLHLPCSGMAMHIHLIQVSLEKAFQKGKENASIAASAKQKLDEFDDLISLGEKGKGEKAMKTLATHITRSRMNPIHVTTSISPVTAPVSSPKRLKVENFKSILRDPKLKDT